MMCNYNTPAVHKDCVLFRKQKTNPVGTSKSQGYQSTSYRLHQPAVTVYTAFLQTIIYSSWGLPTTKQPFFTLQSTGYIYNAS